MDHPQYKRILLKLSGEALMGEAGYGIDPQMLETFASEVETIYQLGVEIGIVIGGGNIYRGIQAAAEGIHKVTGDHMGMLATVINALAMQSTLENRGITTRLQTAIEMEQIAEPFIRRRAVRHLEKGRVVIFGAGTGNPYFTTDTAAALRAVEVQAEAVLKATNVDGVYDSDPRTNPDARKYDRIDYMEAINRGLKIMDLTAFSLCRENNLPVVVFDITVPGNIRNVMLRNDIGTYVGSIDDEQ